MWPHSEGEKHYRCPRVPSATNFGQAGILKTAMRSCHGRELAYVPVLETCLHRLSNPTYWMRSLHLDIFQVSKPKNRLSLFGCLLSALLQEPRNSCWRLLQRPGGQPLLWGHNNDRCHSDKDWLKMYGMRNKVKKKILKCNLMSVGEDCLVLVDYFYNAWGDWWMSMRGYRPMKRGVMVLLAHFIGFIAYFGDFSQRDLPGRCRGALMTDLLITFVPFSFNIPNPWFCFLHSLR